MSTHVSEHQLASFVDGIVDEETAVEIALHLDECPACATRAASLEPLGAAFAAVRDPVPPPELAERVMAEVQQPDRVPALEIALGTGLLAAAAAVAVTTGDVVSVFVRLGVLLDALATAGTQLSVVGNASVFALSLSTLAVAAAMAMAARFTATADRRLP